MNSKVLVSACLLGQRVRYDGGSSPPDTDIVETWRREGRIVAVCPEVAGGLGVPRPPAELRGGGGEAVLDGLATVETQHHEDVSRQYVAGAQAALDLVRQHGIQIAVLKERSPSCGAGVVYDGTFSGTRVEGNGVTAALLLRNGVQIFGESQLDEADAALRALDAVD